MASFNYSCQDLASNGLRTPRLAIIMKANRQITVTLNVNKQIGSIVNFLLSKESACYMLCLFTILATDLSLACASPSLVTRRNIFNPCFSSWGTISGRGERAQGNTSHTAGKSIACAPPGTSFISKLFPGHIHLVIVKAYFPYQPEQKHGRVIKIE